MSAPFRELEKPLDGFAVLCCGCLAESGEMKNMFEWGLADSFAKITEIQLKRDNPSVLLCISCEEQLTSCQKFREQCQNADEVITNVALMQNGGNGANVQESEAAVQDIQENIVTPIMYDKKVVFNIVAPDTVSKIYLPCMYCAEKYIKQKDLIIHLAKMHNVDSKTYVIEAKYYCNIKTCTYFINSGTDCHFLGRKNLNQHCVKVHKTKVLQCSQCNICFPTESYYDRHMKICNQVFVCNICSQTYKTNERLMVHLLRKHPEEHKQYKDCKKLKRKSFTNTEVGLAKTLKSCDNYSLPQIVETDGTRESVLNLKENNRHSQKEKSAVEKFTEFINDSLKRSQQIIETDEARESVLNLEDNNIQSQKEKSAVEKFTEFINDSPKRSQQIIETDEARESVLNLEEKNRQSQKEKSAVEKFTEFINDSPKRSFATQTKLEHNIRNDVTLPSWQTKNDEIIISTSTQTDIFDDLLSLKSQNSEDESSIFFSESVSLSDIQTQTFPLEFGLSRSNKETLTSETQSPDLSIKETQTCVCLYDSPKLNYNRFFDSVSSSPSNNLTSTETQTADFTSRSNVKSDVLLSFNSAETQTSFDESGHDKIL